MIDKRERLKLAVSSYGPNRQVALALGVSAQSVGKWLATGNIDVDNLHALAKLTHYSFNWLAIGEGSMLELTDAQEPWHVSALAAPLVERIARMDQEGTLPAPLITSLNTMLDSFAALAKPRLASGTQLEHANALLLQAKEAAVGPGSFNVGKTRKRGQPAAKKPKS